MSWEDLVRTAKILIVDDEQANVRLLERMLEQGGYEHITSTADARKALELYRTMGPDIVLLDLHMPDLSGLEILEILREEIGPDSYLPIVVITADATPETKLQALVLGAKDFLTKPIDIVETMLRIRVLLETRFLVLNLQREIDHLRLIYGA